MMASHMCKVITIWRKGFGDVASGALDTGMFHYSLLPARC